MNAASAEAGFVPTGTASASVDTLITSQVVSNEFHITADHQGVLDSLEALGVLEGRVIAAGVTNIFSLWDSLQAISASPTMTITAAELSSGDASNVGSLSLTFTSSKETTTFASGDIDVTNGSISVFAGSDDIYTATFTPAGEGACTVDVAAEAFESLVGRLNEAAEQFTWTYDATPPTIAITASEVSSGDASNDGTLSLTFTASENTEDFVASDVTTSNGTLSSFSGSGDTYTATLTPDAEGAVTIDVAGSAFTDAATNDNTAATQFNWTYDVTGPQLFIAAAGSFSFNSGSATNDANLTVTFGLSEEATDFSDEDVSVTNGALSSFAGSGLVYTATFTPSGDGACTIDVAAGEFTDEAGNSNSAANTFLWNYDGTAPTVTIAAAEVSDGDTSSDATLSLTFTTSENTSDFAVGDVDVTNGALSSFAGSGSTYTAIFTPSGDGACTIDVASSAFEDPVGNGNIAADQFNWTYDTTGPTMAITAAEVNDAGSSNDAALSLTFTSSEATTNFTVDDIAVTNGELSNFAASSSTVYTAMFTPTAFGATTIDVAAGSFTDAVGNDNSVADQFNWEYVDVVTFSRNFSGSLGPNVLRVQDESFSLNTDPSAWYVATLATGYEGDLINLSQTHSSLTITQGLTTAVLTCTSWYVNFSDPDYLYCGPGYSGEVYTSNYGGSFDASQPVIITIDEYAVPTVSISASEVNDGGSSNDASLSLTFTTSESTVDFDASDIQVTNGSITNFAGSGTTYTATFTPSADGDCSVNVDENAFTSANGVGNAAATEFNWTYASAVSYNYNSIGAGDWISIDAGEVVATDEYGNYEVSPNSWAFVAFAHGENQGIDDLVGTSESITLSQTNMFGNTSVTMQCSNWALSPEYNYYDNAAVMCSEWDGAVISVTVVAGGGFQEFVPVVVTIN